MQFTWTFPQFIVSPVYDGMTNVVTAINWVCTGTDGFVTSSNSGTVNLEAPNPAQFVPYDQITQEMAFSWVSQSINTTAVQAGIAAQITQISKSQVQPQNPPF